LDQQPFGTAAIWFGYYFIPQPFTLPTIFKLLFDLATFWVGNYLVWQLFDSATFYLANYFLTSF
jgi:hypothetical protein